MADTHSQENLPSSPMAVTHAKPESEINPESEIIEEGESNEVGESEQIKEPEPNEQRKEPKEQRAQETLARLEAAKAHQEAGRKEVDELQIEADDAIGGGGADVKVKKAEKRKGGGAAKGGGGGATKGAGGGATKGRGATKGVGATRGGGASKGGGGGADVKAKAKAKQVLVPIADGTDAIEATVTIDVLRLGGAEVIVASVETRMEKEVNCYSRVKIIANELITKCDGEFDLIAIPGGSEKAVTTLANCETLKKMVKNQGDKNKLCAAIGAARDLLVLFTGKKDMWSTATESRCVEDNNTVTSKGPGSAIEYAIVLVRKLYGVDMANKVSKLLVGSPQYGVKYAFKEQEHVDWMIYKHQKILVPVADGTREMEAIIIVDVLQRAGAKVVVASVNGDRSRKQIKASNGVKFVADEQLDNVANDTFALIVLPGNLADAMIFQRSDILVKMLKEQNDGNKPYGAICLSPILVLQKHGLLEGRKATAPRLMCNMLEDPEYAAHRVVVDGNVATSQGPGSSMEFALVIVEKLFGKEKAIDLAVSMAFCKKTEFE